MATNSITDKIRTDALLADIDRWNSTPSDERGLLLRQNLWGPYNSIVKKLTVDEMLVLKHHQDDSFRLLREMFTAGQNAGFPLIAIEQITNQMMICCRKFGER